jgi:hypothetical protein
MTQVRAGLFHSASALRQYDKAHAATRMWACREHRYGDGGNSAMWLRIKTSWRLAPRAGGSLVSFDSATLAASRRPGLSRIARLHGCDDGSENELVATFSKERWRQGEQPPKRSGSPGTAPLKAAKKLNCITGIAAVFALLAGAEIIASVLDARTATVDANRAWIQAEGADISGNINGSGDLPVRIHYINLGKGPALQINRYFLAGSIDDSATPTDPLDPGKNNTCDGLTIDPRGGRRLSKRASSDVVRYSLSAQEHFRLGQNQ